MGGVRVRPATEGDAASLAGLMGVLGYPTDPAAMSRRLSRILPDPSFATFVAEDGAGPVGVVGVMRGWTYNQDEPFARIVVLVVGEAARGTGAGAALVRAAEAWAREQGAATIHLTTASHREGAHGFYAHLGYQATGTRFHRRLDG